MAMLIFKVINFCTMSRAAVLAVRWATYLSYCSQLRGARLANNARYLWSQLVEVAPNFAGYQKRTSREIPMVILHPVEERLSA